MTTDTELRKLCDEAELVLAHFREHPVLGPDEMTEENAVWIMRYDSVRQRLAALKKTKKEEAIKHHCGIHGFIDPCQSCPQCGHSIFVTEVRPA